MDAMLVVELTSGTSMSTSLIVILDSVLIMSRALPNTNKSSATLLLIKLTHSGVALSL
jgi:hypothetical protein